MQILVNGKDMDVQDGLSVAGLLERLQVRREFTAVALNREIMRRSAYAGTVLREGDSVEIVHPMGGG